MMASSSITLKGLEGFKLRSTQVVEEGPFSTVVREKWVARAGEETLVAVKTAPARRRFSKEPHDIIKEVRVLSHLSHINVIDILGERYTTTDSASLSFWMPYIPYSLPQLLASPSFSPHSFTGSTPPFKAEQFALLAKSIMFQIIAALGYLHSKGVAHRDVKPHNILLTDQACVKLIDFGIAWKPLSSTDHHHRSSRQDLWPERPDKMYFDVSTGPYRAPELLFGPQSYDAFATDIWSLGATFAEFFTPLRLSNVENTDDYAQDLTPDSPDVNHNPSKTPFITPSFPIGFSNTQWSRDTLFHSGRGEIGLIWSIFKTRGTPTDETWPTFKDLPHASTQVTFNDVGPTDLSLLLPNLPPGVIGSEAISVAELHAPPDVMASSPLDLLNRFLVYPPTRRLGAAHALRHPWFENAPPVLLPPGYPTESFEVSGLPRPSAHVWENKNLGEWLMSFLNRPVGAVTDS